MSQTSLKQQIFNYSALFKQVLVSYYGHQKKLFWLVQILMVISTITGLFWIMSIILGISHYQNPENTEDFKYLLFSWIFDLPLWQWLLIASLAGIVSAWTLYASIQTGVRSVLAYQMYLSKKCLYIVSHDKYNHWINEFEQSSRQVLLRLLRQGVQLTGLVSRRMANTFVSLVTFILSFIVLLYLDAKLLLLLIPLSVFYIVALYFINRYAARVSTEMANTLPVSSSRFNQLVSRVLNRKLIVDSHEFNQQFDDTLYMRQAELKYQRRLAEVHVGWLNTMFLVLGIANIVIYIAYIQASENIDWQHLLFFLIALKYAASSLQQISAITVAFSRFLPEVQLVFRLLNIIDTSAKVEKIDIKQNVFIYIPSSCLDDFEINQIKNVLNFNQNVSILTISKLREMGMNDFFKQMQKSSTQNIIIDNNLQRFKRIITTHRKILEPMINSFIVFSSHKQNIKYLTLNQILQHTQTSNNEELDLDAFE